VNWIHMTHNRIQWPILVYTVMSFLVSKRGQISLPSGLLLALEERVTDLGFFSYQYFGYESHAFVN
jgi:hypothetical protein